MHRVQMVLNGINAYQSDLSTEAYALVVAGELASGHPCATKVQYEGDAARYQLPNGSIRVFELSKPGSL